MQTSYVSVADIQAMDKRYRAAFVNSLSGFKSANLVGSQNLEGVHNLAIVSSVVHLGSDPALLGMVVRPPVVPRHSYENILATGSYTLNHVNDSIYEQGHQTAARYPEEVSEFEAVGLTPIYSATHQAPYVAEAHVRIGLQLAQTMPIELNGTVLVIGRITEVFYPEAAQAADGYLDIQKARTIALSGTDAYHNTNKLTRLSYAKPNIALTQLEGFHD